MSLIETHNLGHRFDDGSVGIDDISLAVAAGEFVLVAGPNGSGKTTLYRHFNGLLKPTSGSIAIDGVSVQNDLVRARRTVGMVFQDADAQIVGDTVAGDVAFGPENLGLPRPEIERRLSEALEIVGLTSHFEKPPHILSGGEKRRLAIAGVLAMQPKILVFDEPFSNLDYPGARMVLHHILELHQRGHTIVVSTHDLEKVAAYADRMIIMAGGKIVRDDRPSELIDTVERFGIRRPCDTRYGKEVRPWLA